MGKPFSTTHAGRLVEVEPIGGWTGTTVRPLIDGREVARAKGNDQVTVRADGLEVRTWPAWHGESFKRAELVIDGADPAVPMPLDPPAGTWAAPREGLARRHPALAAARHPAAGVAKVLIGLIGFSFLLGLLPHISLPSIPWPSIDLPSIPSPSIDLPLPSIHLPPLPGWVRAVIDTKQYWGPIVIGLAYGVAEYERRRRQRPAAEQACEADTEPQAPTTAHAGSEPSAHTTRQAASQRP